MSYEMFPWTYEVLTQFRSLDNLTPDEVKELEGGLSYLSHSSAPHNYKLSFALLDVSKVRPLS